MIFAPLLEHLALHEKTSTFQFLSNPSNGLDFLHIVESVSLRVLQYGAVSEVFFCLSS